MVGPSAGRAQTFSAQWALSLFLLPWWVEGCSRFQAMQHDAACCAAGAGSWCKLRDSGTPIVLKAPRDFSATRSSKNSSWESAKHTYQIESWNSARSVGA